MKKLIKILYNTTDDGIDFDCLNECPFNEQDYMCGSVACKDRCKYCFGSGKFPAFVLNDHKTVGKNKFVFHQGWIYCGKTYNNKKDWLLRRIIYVIKLQIKKNIFKEKYS